MRKRKEESASHPTTPFILERGVPQVTPIMKFEPGRHYYDREPVEAEDIMLEIHLKIQIQRVWPEIAMLVPAVNRQPGFRRGTRRAKQRREEQPCCRLAG